MLVRLVLLLSIIFIPAECFAEKHPQTDNLVITCIDFRFQHTINKWIEENLGSADHVAVAGSAKCLLETDSQELLLKQVDLAYRLHGVQIVSLIDHMDCGAYGGSAAFPDAKEEFGVHVACLRRAAQVIRRQHPKLTVRLYLITADQKLKPIELE